MSAIDLTNKQHAQMDLVEQSLEECGLYEVAMKVLRDEPSAVEQCGYFDSIDDNADDEAFEFLHYVSGKQFANMGQALFEFAQHKTFNENYYTI